MRKITRDKVIREIAAIAFSDFSKFAAVETDEKGGQVLVLTDTARLTADSKKAIASVKAGTKGIEVKLYDKLRALEILGRACGFFEIEDKSEQQALDELRALFERSDVFGDGTVSDE